MKHISRLLSFTATAALCLASSGLAEESGYGSAPYGGDQSGGSYGQSSPYGSSYGGSSSSYPQGYDGQPPAGRGGGYPPSSYGGSGSSGGGGSYGGSGSSGGGGSYGGSGSSGGGGSYGGSGSSGGGGSYGGSGSYGGYDNPPQSGSYGGGSSGWQQQPSNRSEPYGQPAYRPESNRYPPAVQRSYGNEGGYPPQHNTGGWRDSGQGGSQGSQYGQSGGYAPSQPYNQPQSGGGPSSSYGSQPYGGSRQSAPPHNSGYNPFEGQSNIPPDNSFFGREPPRRPDERLAPPPTGGSQYGGPVAVNPWVRGGEGSPGRDGGGYPPNDRSAMAPPGGLGNSDSTSVKPGQIIAPEAVPATPPPPATGTTAQP